MELSTYFKSVIDGDPAGVVLCNTEHTIIYMNPAAKLQYAKYGGEALMGRSLLDCHNAASRARILTVLEHFQSSPACSRVFTFRNEAKNRDTYMVALRDGAGNLIGYYEKYEYRTPETAVPYSFEV